MKLTAKYVFVDPGVRNLGILFVGFANKKIQLSNHTIDCSDNNFNEIQKLDESLIGLERPFYFFVETNYFKENPEQTKKINTNLGALQFFLIDRYKLGPTDFLYHEKPAMAIAQFFNLTGNPGMKKRVILRAFNETFKASGVSVHEADAFAAGACIILMNSNLEVEQDLRDLAQIFEKNVRELSQLNNTANNEKYADAERWVRAWRGKKRKTNLLVNVTEPTYLEFRSF